VGRLAGPATPDAEDGAMPKQAEDAMRAALERIAGFLEQ
jgi:hypothetical protein